VPPIYVVVVEYHHHALEHIHSILRRRKSLLKPWSMLHLDAHPDLACPSDNVPAISCFLPRGNYDDKDNNLYELLDSNSSGIAEWILPLVLAGGLHHVHWIKPPESRQLPIGKHEYNVGAWVSPVKDTLESNVCVTSFLGLPPSARLRVDWRHSYYLDDESVVPTKELTLFKPLQLTVSELQEKPEQELQVNTIHALSFDGDIDWTLDICLDYFCCRNPFLTDIEAINETFAESLVHVATSTRMQTATSGDCLLDPENYKQLLARFQYQFQQVLQEKGDAAIDEMLQFYECKQEARGHFDKLVDSLSTSPDPDKLANMAMEALPNLCMPHETTKSLEEVEESIQLRVEAIHSALKRTKKDPFMITFARSTLDGFTPMGVVEKLQDDILTSVHDVYCGCNVLNKLNSTGPSIRPELFTSASNCRFKVIFDFGEWEGSTFDR